jgi:transglutaminase-like putative cysteine protease
MRTHVNKLLQIATGFLVISGYLALATTDRAPMLFLMLPVMFLGLAPFGQWLDRRFPPYRQLTTAMNMLYLIAIPLMFSRMSLLDTVTALVIYIQFYLLIHQTNERNYRYLYLMSFFLLLSASVQSPDPGIGLVLVLFLVSAVWALILLQLKHEFDRVDMDREGRTVRLLGEETEVFEEELEKTQHQALVATVSGITVSAFVLAMAFFLLTPRIEAGLLGRGDDIITRTGLSSDINLAGGGLIETDTTPLMRVEFPDETDGEFGGDMYWRVATYNFYTESRWLNLGMGGREDYLPPRQYFDSRIQNEQWFLFREPELPEPEVRQIIYLDRAINDGLPVMDAVRKARLISASKRNAALAWSASHDGSIQMVPEADGAALTYEAWSEVRQPDLETLRRAPDEYDQVMTYNMYRRYTNHELLPETVQLAATIVAPHDRVVDRVLAVERWLTDPRNDFVYSLSFPPLPAQNPVDVFINRSRLGHCELFASALALMVRSQGIPARVVSGLRGAEWNPSSRAYIVRSDMAHLWVEVYFIGVGWVRFDPSPPTNIDTSAMGWLSRLVSQQLMSAKMLWYQNVVGFNQGIQLDQLRDIGIGIGGAWVRFFTRQEEADEVTPGTEPASRIEVTRVLASLAVLAAGVLVLVYLRRRRPDEGPLLTPDQERARKLYVLLRRKLRRLGASLAGKTADEIAQDAVGFAITPCQPVIDTVRIYNEARFGRGALAVDVYKHMRQEITRLKRVRD